MKEAHVVVIGKQSCEVLSASPDSYTFIGKRLYYAFDQLIAPEDRELFQQQLQLCSGEQFPLHLLDADYRPILYLAAIKPSVNTDAAVVTLTPVAELLSSVQELNRLLDIKNQILSLYDDEYFFCDPKTQRLRIFKTGRYDQPIVDTELHHFFDRILQHAAPHQLDEVKQFCNDFQAQKPTLYLLAEGNLTAAPTDAATTLIRGQTMQENGRYTGTVGMIHYGTQQPGGIQRAAERDSLTGILPKSEITSIAINLINIQKARNTTLAIIDVDYFKQVNDTFGHMGGDAVLQHVAAIIEDAVGSHGMVGRIGGDEFLVIFFRKGNMEEHREILRSVKNRVSAAYPSNQSDTPSVTLSIGCAAYPKDADTYESVFQLADYALYRAKELGRNRYVIFDRSKHGDPELILQMQTRGSSKLNRGSVSAGDVMGVLAARVFHGDSEPIEQLLEQAAVDLGIQRMMLYAGDPWRCICTAGEKRPDEQLLRDTAHYLNDPALMQMVDQHGVLLCNDTKRLAAKGLPAYDLMKQLGILSFIHLHTTDADGRPVVLSLESVSKRVTWNENNVIFYTLFQQILHCYHFDQ